MKDLTIGASVAAAFETYLQVGFLLTERYPEMSSQEFQQAALSIAQTACIMRSLWVVSDDLDNLADELHRIGDQLELISTDQSIISGRG